MANEKLTVKKVITIVLCTALGTVAFYLLYLGILFFSLPFTANAVVSWILSLSITMGIILLFGGYALKKRKNRRN